MGICDTMISLNTIKTKYDSFSEPVKASVWYMVCNVLNKGIALFSTPIFTRILTEEQYGTFAIFQSWYNIILIFTSLNIFLGGYQKGLILFRNDRERFTSTQLSLTTLITLCFGILYLSNIDFWTKIFELPPILMAAMFVGLTLMPALEFWAAKERFDFKYIKYVAVSLSMTILSLGGGVLAVINTSYKVEARVFTDVASKAIFAGVLFIILFIRGKKIFVKEYWIYALKFNIPLLPHYLSNYVLNQSDRIMIGRMIGNDKAAFYSVAYTISTMMLLITSAINNSLTPYIYKEIDIYEQKKVYADVVSKKIKNITKPLFLMVACLCIMTIAFAPEVILIFAGEKYTEAIYVVPPIAASVFFIFLYSMFSTIEYYFQKTGLIAVATTVSAIINLVLNYIFIKAFGYYAAGYTTLLCYICLAVMHYLFYKKVLRLKMPEVSNVYDMKVVLIGSIFVLAIMIVMVLTYKMIIIRYAIVVVMCIITIWKREYLISTIKGFKKK